MLIREEDASTVIRDTKGPVEVLEVHGFLINDPNSQLMPSR